MLGPAGGNRSSRRGGVLPLPSIGPTRLFLEASSVSSQLCWVSYHGLSLLSPYRSADIYDEVSYSVANTGCAARRLRRLTLGLAAPRHVGSSLAWGSSPVPSMAGEDSPPLSRQAPSLLLLFQINFKISEQFLHFREETEHTTGAPMRQPPRFPFVNILLRTCDQETVPVVNILLRTCDQGNPILTLYAAITNCSLHSRSFLRFT